MTTTPIVEIDNQDALIFWWMDNIFNDKSIPTREIIDQPIDYKFFVGEEIDKHNDEWYNSRSKLDSLYYFVHKVYKLFKKRLTELEITEIQVKENPNIYYNKINRTINFQFKIKIKKIS